MNYTTKEWLMHHHLQIWSVKCNVANLIQLKSISLTKCNHLLQLINLNQFWIKKSKNYNDMYKCKAIGVNGFLRLWLLRLSNLLIVVLLIKNPKRLLIKINLTMGESTPTNKWLPLEEDLKVICQVALIQIN